MISPIRFGGIASGLDTDLLVSQLMTAERMPLNKLNQQKQKLAWKREAYQEMNTQLTALRTLTDKLRFTTSFNKQSASSSNESVIKATSSSNAVSGSYSIQVNSLASSALVTGDTTNINLKDKIGVAAEQTFTLTGPKGDIEVKVTPNSTYESVIKQINAANSGVNFSFDSINKRFMATTTSTGESAVLKVDDPDGVLRNFFKLDPASFPQTGSNASVTINGTTMELENNSFEFNGVRFDIQGVSTSAVSVTVSQDTQNISSIIKDFVEQYNALVDSINGATKTVPNRSYAPLTNEQKESMTEKQIELWESKAKTGLLYRDSILQETLTSFRGMLLQSVEGLPEEFNSLSDIGIAFKKFVPGMTGELGKLELDERKLQDAISQNPEAVMNLFTKTTSLKPGEQGYVEGTGYGDRLYNALNTSINKIIKQIGTTTISDSADSSMFGQQFRDLNSRINTLEDRLKAVEERYYKQFTAMEKTLHKLNSQASWIAQQLGQ